MKARMLAAAGIGLAFLSAITMTSLSAASAATNFGNQNVPGPYLAGGARYSSVQSFYPAGKPIRATFPVYLCSTGIPWRLNNGTRGFLTAGHCPPSPRTSAQVFVGTFGSNRLFGAPIGTGAASWTTTNSKGTIPGKSGDIAFIASRMPVYGKVFVGAPGSTSLLPITSWTSTGGRGGDKLCYSGMSSGSKCDFKVGKQTTWSDNGAKMTGLAEGYKSFGSACPVPGDSGGAVFRMQKDGKSVVAVGILSGGNVPGYGGVFGCHMLYTNLGTAQKHFGGGPILN